MSDIDRVRRERQDAAESAKRRRRIDDEEFKKMMRGDKISETDWEGKQKGKGYQPQEEAVKREENVPLQQGVEKEEAPSLYEPQFSKEPKSPVRPQVEGEEQPPLPPPPIRAPLEQLPETGEQEEIDIEGFEPSEVQQPIEEPRKEKVARQEVERILPKEVEKAPEKPKVTPPLKKKQVSKPKQQAEVRGKEKTERAEIEKPKVTKENIQPVVSTPFGEEEKPTKAEAEELSFLKPELPAKEVKKEGLKKPPSEVKQEVVKPKEAEGKKGALAIPETAEEKKEVAKPPVPEAKKEVAEEIIETQPPPPLPLGAWEASRDLEKKEEKKGESKGIGGKIGGDSPPVLQSGSLSQAGTQMGPGGQARAEPLAPLSAAFANLPAHVLQLFERLVGVMTVMTTSGITETTVNLNNPQFESSPFFGTQIVITEYSTAPKAFNIQMLGNEKAVRLMTANTNELVAAFQTGNYNFKVNRIETGYLTYAPEERKREIRRVKRKKSGEE